MERPIPPVHPRRPFPSPEPPPKRPVRHLSVSEKLDAIRRVHEGESKASVARVIGVPESTLRGWCKNEDKLAASAAGVVPEAKRRADRERELDEALRFWSRNQQEHGQTAKEAAGGWFWRWYKSYGYAAAASSPPLRAKAGESVLVNVNDNALAEDSKENQSEDEEDEPPETAAEALRHGHKFLRWLECCSDPSVTAVQLLQFRYLLNNVKACAERRASRPKPASRAKRK